jgi:hypothetical protein
MEEPRIGRSRPKKKLLQRHESADAPDGGNIPYKSETPPIIIIIIIPIIIPIIIIITIIIIIIKWLGY